MNIPRAERRLVGGRNEPGIGIDPGCEGAGAYVVGRTVRRVVVWTRSTATIFDAERPAPVKVPIANMWAALSKLPRDGVTSTAVEFVRSLPGHSHGEVLVETAGYACAWLDAWGLPEPVRPPSVDWRRDVLGVREASGAKACGAAAVSAYVGRPAVGSREFVIWDLVRPGACGLELPEHGCEAVAMALWGLGWRLGGASDQRRLSA